eukprot:TRINITY_DN61410_c0_g1_i1.p1 TRINITY_DN61410_c0_g1~~TRINITY_DN61410_c0_g1_i1.p1  ORF type:complete len:171 (-),score=37.27 TRINITY_DN61410_c0_g1_i1:164-676(-)
MSQSALRGTRRCWLLAVLSCIGFIVSFDRAGLAEVPSAKGDWRDSYTIAEKALKEAASMVSDARTVMGKINSEQMTDRDKEQLAHVWAQYERARARYRLAEAHMKEAKAQLSKDMKQLVKDAKKRSITLPAEQKAHLDDFQKHLDEQITAIHDVVENLNSALDKARGAVK